VHRDRFFDPGALLCQQLAGSFGVNQNVTTRSLSANSFATSGGVIQRPLTFCRSCSLAPRASAQARQTNTGTS
jgi:hypothetical protein